MSRLKDAALWLPRQAKGTLSNAREAVSDFELGDLLPPWIAQTVVFVRDSLPRSIGFSSTAGEQLTATVTWSVALVVASATILTPVGVVWVLLFGPIALLRLIPAVEERWPLNEQSWPLWEVRR